jgi:uncharacterized UBP type Zn finger protein
MSMLLSNARFLLQRLRRSPPTPCEHLVEIRAVERRSAGCEECEEQQAKWVHLRMCLTCGHVGCCDSSKGKHATGHFKASGHPIMRAVEPGQSWLWCYVDERLIQAP